jgi:cleavage and polyadenylation specificity factor subunit 4
MSPPPPARRGAAAAAAQPKKPYTYDFSFTPFLRANGLAALASTVPVCADYAASGHCPRGRRCPDRHPTPAQQQQQYGSHSFHYGRNNNNDNYVCKHWLKGLCKKGDACDYLHEYNLRKMSECQFFNQNGYCQNGDECLYVHVKEDSKLPLCDDYNKGFCERGPRCGKRHVRRRLCEFYLAGFCPDGRNCKHGVHLKSNLGAGQTGDKATTNPGAAAAGAGAAAAAQRRDVRMVDFDKREDDQPGAQQQGRKDLGWRGGRGGKGGRWRNKRDRGGR